MHRTADAGLAQLVRAICPSAAPSGETLAALDWRRATEVARAHHIGGLLYWQCRRVRFAPPSEISDTLHDLYVRSCASAVLTDDILRRVTRAAVAAGVPIILLKGAAFRRCLYEHPAARLMRDVDLLVRPEDCEPLHGALVSAGFSITTEGQRPASAAESFERRYLRAESPYESVVEVHRSLGNTRRYNVDGEELFYRAQPLGAVGDEGALVRTLSCEDHLLHQAVHQINHAFAEIDLRAVIDVHELVTQLRPRWPSLVERAHRWGVAGALFLVLERAQALSGTAVPDDVLAALRPGRVREKWLRLWLDSAAEHMYRHFRHGALTKRVVVSLALPDPLGNRVRFAAYYAGLRVRDFLATARRRSI